MYKFEFSLAFLWNFENCQVRISIPLRGPSSSYAMQIIRDAGPKLVISDCKAHLAEEAAWYFNMRKLIPVRKRMIQFEIQIHFQNGFSESALYWIKSYLFNSLSDFLFSFEFNKNGNWLTSGFWFFWILNRLPILVI